MAAFRLRIVPKSLWLPIYWITQCLLWEICHCCHQGALQDFDIGVPLLTDQSSSTAHSWSPLGWGRSCWRANKPRITRSNWVWKISQSQTLVEIALWVDAKSCLKLHCSLLNKMLLKIFTTGSNTVFSYTLAEDFTPFSQKWSLVVAS